MVKFDARNIPEEQKSSGDKKSTPAEGETTQDKFDLSFITDQEEKPGSDTETKSSYFDDEPPRRQNLLSSKETFKGGYEEEPPGFDSSFPKNRMILILGAVGLALIILFVYLWLGPGSSNTGDTQDITFTTPSKAPPAVEPENTMPGYLKSRFAQNQGENQLYLNYANSLLGVSSSNYGYTLLVITSDGIYMSVLGGSRDAIAEFRRSIKDQSPGLVMNVVSTQDKYVNGNKKILADFSVPVTTSGAGNAASLSMRSFTPTDVRSLVSSLAQKYNLRTSYFQQGDQEREGQFQKTYYYATVNGSRSSIVQFLQDISQTHPEISFIKISMYPYNTGVINGENLNARIEIAYYNPS